MSDHEAILTSAYVEQTVLYAGALGAAQSLALALSQGGAGEAEMEQLMAALGDVRQIDTHIAAAKAAWQRYSNKPGPELSAALGNVTDLVQKVMACLENAEKIGKSQHKHLIHDLDDLARGKNMQRAYETARLLAEVHARGA